MSPGGGYTTCSACGWSGSLLDANRHVCGTGPSTPTTVHPLRASTVTPAWTPKAVTRPTVAVGHERILETIPVVWRWVKDPGAGPESDTFGLHVDLGKLGGTLEGLSRDAFERLLVEGLELLRAT